MLSDLFSLLTYIQDIFQTGPELVGKCKPGLATLGEENLRNSCGTVGKGLFSMTRGFRLVFSKYFVQPVKIICCSKMLISETEVGWNLFFIERGLKKQQQYSDCA